MSTSHMQRPGSVVAVYSGGIDSTVLLYSMLDEGIDIRGALSVDYGQKHRKEIDAAASVCGRLGIRHEIADLRGAAGLFGGSGLVNPSAKIPEGHYEEASMKATVVPNRNMILIALATAWAISRNAEAVAYAAHSGDHAIYPDCREAFAEALDRAIGLCDWSAVSLYRPFVGKSKAEIVALGAKLGAPMSETWSCYKGRALHCGKCGTCIERREAFFLTGIEDGTRYAADAPSIDALVDADWRISH